MGGLLKRVAGLVGLGVIVPLLILAVGEGTASAWLFARDVSGIQVDTNFRRARYDSLVGWVGLPNLHLPDMFSPGVGLTTNAEGMRIAHPVTPELAPGTKRLICSGDSFTNGWGVGDADTFCAQLEGRVPGLETLNMAQPGYGIDQAYLWYKRDGARWPHQVHLFAFIWNDFERMAVANFSGYAKPTLKVEAGAPVVATAPTPDWSGSIRRYYWSRIALPKVRLFQLADRGVNGSDSVQLARVESQVWDVAEAVFRDLDRLNKARGSQLVLAWLPTGSELTPSVYDRRRARVAAFAERAGIPFVDLTPPIRQVPADTAAWFFITANQLQTNGASGHYTRRGHAWVADELARTLPALLATRGVAFPGGSR